MKVVLFCGGLGTRIREDSDKIPKPMVNIGYRPIMWHLMKYYAHYGHKDFILCLGYKSEFIKNYFLHYDECISNDFILKNGCRDITLLNSDIQDWNISFVFTGLHSNVGQRLLAVKKYLADDDVFMANYADGLTNLPLPQYLENFSDQDKIASFLCVKPSQSFHVVCFNGNNTLDTIKTAQQTDLWVNGGFFIFKKDIFNYINKGKELVGEPFQRLINEKQIIAYKYNGFWMCMDTFKEKQRLEELYFNENAPWTVWNSSLIRKYA